MRPDRGGAECAASNYDLKKELLRLDRMRIRGAEET